MVTAKHTRLWLKVQFMVHPSTNPDLAKPFFEVTQETDFFRDAALSHARKMSLQLLEKLLPAQEQCPVDPVVGLQMMMVTLWGFAARLLE
eukprot:s69_g4.t1